MTLTAIRYFPVSLVASGAEEFRVESRMLFQFLTLLFVAGQTRSREVCRQFHLKRRVRVGMAGAATADLIMRFTLVAHTANRDYLFLTYHRGMSLMTVHTAHSGLMFAPLAVNSPLHRCVTLDTVCI